MRKVIAAMVFAALSCGGFCSGQSNQPPDSYPPRLDWLESLTVLPLPHWRYHADIPHPEDPELNDADGQPVKTREEWKTGSRVLRRWTEIPDKINGYATEGSRENLELSFDIDDRLGITVFSNGALVARSFTRNPRKSRPFAFASLGSRDRAGIAGERVTPRKDKVVLVTGTSWAASAVHGSPLTLVDRLPLPPYFLLYPLAPRLHLRGTLTADSKSRAISTARSIFEAFDEA